MSKPFKLCNLRGTVADVAAKIDKADIPDVWKGAIKSAIPEGVGAVELHAHCTCPDDSKPLPEHPQAREFLLQIHIKPLF